MENAIDEIARERISDHDRRLEGAEERVGAIDMEISDVRRTVIQTVTKLEEVISFHKELKKYASIAILGILGLLGTQLWQMIVKH